MAAWFTQFLSRYSHLYGCN